MHEDIEGHWSIGDKLTYGKRLKRKAIIMKSDGLKLNKEEESKREANRNPTIYMK